jgi:hypothetical protein
VSDKLEFVDILVGHLCPTSFAASSRHLRARVDELGFNLESLNEKQDCRSHARRCCWIRVIAPRLKPAAPWNAQT